MMRLMIRVDVAESVRRGQAAPVEQPAVIEVDPATLSPDERAVLASRLTDDGQVVSRSETGYVQYRTVGSGGGPYCSEQIEPSGNRYTVVRAPAATVEAVIEAIRAEDEAIRTLGAPRAAEAAAKAERERAESLAALAGPPSRQQITRWAVVSDTGTIVHRDYRGAAPSEVQVVEWSYLAEWPVHLSSAEVRDSAEASAQAARLTAETEARRVAAESAAEDRIRGLDRLRQQWISQHGSPRLQRLVVEGLGHQATYLAERRKWNAARLEADLAAHRPGWQAVDETALKLDLADLSQRSLAILDAARVLAGGAKLARHDGRIVAWERYTTSYGESVVIVWPKD